MRQLLLFMISALAILASTPSNAQSPEGLWSFDAGDGDMHYVQVSPCGALLCAHTVGLMQPCDGQGHDRFELENPERNQSPRKLIGLQIISDIRKAGTNLWHGTLYAPLKAQEYSLKFHLVGNDEVAARAYKVIDTRWTGKDLRLTRMLKLPANTDACRG